MKIKFIINFYYYLSLLYYTKTVQKIEFLEVSHKLHEKITRKICQCGFLFIASEEICIFCKLTGDVT